MKEVKLINLPKIVDRRGNLSFIEELNHLPFKIERCHLIYDVPGGEKRGGHAYRETEEFIVALSGSFDIVINKGREEEVFHLNRSYYGLYIPNMIWREINNFSTNSLCLIISSTAYNEKDYIRDFNRFKKLSAQ